MKVATVLSKKKKRKRVDKKVSSIFGDSDSLYLHSLGSFFFRLNSNIGVITDFFFLNELKF